MTEKSYNVLTKSGAGTGEFLKYKNQLLARKVDLAIRVAKYKAKQQSKAELRRREPDAR